MSNNVNCDFFKDVNEKRIVGKLAFSWCTKNLKKSKFHESHPKFIMKNRDDNLKGYFKHSKNIICVYLGSHNEKIDLIETILHEWKHYQQDIKGMYRKYITRYKRNNVNHPYEITARNFSKKYIDACYKWVNKNIK